MASFQNKRIKNFNEYNILVRKKGGNLLFEKLRQSKLMFWSLELLIIAALIMISSEINFIFEPIGTFFPRYLHLY